MSGDRLEKELTLQIANTLKVVLNVKESQKHRVDAFSGLENTISKFTPELSKKFYEKIRATLEQLFSDR
jgi:ribosomal protein L19